MPSRVRTSDAGVPLLYGRGNRIFKENIVKRSLGLLALCLVLVVSLAGCQDSGDKQWEQKQKAAIEGFLVATNSTIKHDGLTVSAKDKSFTLKNVRGSFTVTVNEFVPVTKVEYSAGQLKGTGVNFVDTVPSGAMNFAAKVALTNSTVKTSAITDNPLELSNTTAHYDTLTFSDVKGDFSTFKAIASANPLTLEQRKGLLSFSMAEMSYAGYSSIVEMTSFESLMQGKVNPENPAMTIKSSAKGGWIKDVNASGLGEHFAEATKIFVDNAEVVHIDKTGGKAIRVPGFAEAVIQEKLNDDMIAKMNIELDTLYVDGVTISLPTGEKATLKYLDTSAKINREATSFAVALKSLVLPSSMTDMAGAAILLVQQPLSSFHKQPLSFSGELNVAGALNADKTAADITVNKIALAEDNLGGFAITAKLLAALSPDAGSTIMIDRMETPKISKFTLALKDTGLLEFLFGVAAASGHSPVQGMEGNPGVMRHMVASGLTMVCMQAAPPFVDFCSDLAKYISEPNLFELALAPEAPLSVEMEPEALMLQTPKTLGLTWKYTPPAPQVAPAAPAQK